jgi:hypothetical protein
MNRSKPAIVVGGGEMNRVTSSVVRNASSDGASESRSSRRVTPLTRNVGSDTRQLALATT